MVKPFRFGVNMGPAKTLAEWRAAVHKIEDLGYAVLTVPDHLTDLLAPIPALVGAADATKRIRIGTNVLNNDLRHPAVVAREAATVDTLSGGRFELGLGAGSIRSEYDAAGLRFDRGAVRVERLGEAVTVIKGLLKGEQTTFSGRYYQASGDAHTVRSLQKPHPPILIGGNGPRLLELAAREADIVGFSGITFKNGGASPPDLSGWRVSEVDHRVWLVREAAGEHRYERLELNALVQRVILTDQPRKAAEELTNRWPQLTADEFLQSPYLLIGTAEQMVENLLARRQRWGISYYTIRESYAHTFAPVVSSLAGK